MLLRIVRILAFLGAVFWALLVNHAHAQHLAPQTAPAQRTPVSLDPARNPASTLGDALRQLSARSGVVFLGRVDHIDRQPAVVTITLQVLEPVLGNPGTTYTLREWAGLWTLGRERYTLGQRALFFLHAPGASGLSSPVDGQFGVIPLLPTTADAEPQLDARWLATRLQRTSAAPSLAAGTFSLADAHTVITHWNSPQAIEPQLHPMPVALRATVAEQTR